MSIDLSSNFLAKIEFSDFLTSKFSWEKDNQMIFMTIMTLISFFKHSI